MQFLRGGISIEPCKIVNYSPVPGPQNKSNEGQADQNAGKTIVFGFRAIHFAN